MTIGSSLAGGALIGLASASLLLVNGRVAGISGIAGGLLAPRRGDLAWRAWFLAGLLGGGVLLALLGRGSFPARGGWSAPVVVVAGLLVGYGTRLGSGCTSGHGVCGLGRFSKRSLVATLTFMATAAATVFVVRHLVHA